MNPSRSNPVFQEAAEGIRQAAESGIVCRELLPAPNPVEAFLRLVARGGCIFLDSAQMHPRLGRYSFIAADPLDRFECSPDQPDLWRRAGGWLGRFSSPTIPGLPPFQGGAAGLFSYDLNRTLERIPPARYDEFSTPAMVLGLYDVVLAFDHQSGRAWLISQGWPESQPQHRRRQAEQRLALFLRWLQEPAPPGIPMLGPGEGNGGARISERELAPQHPAGEMAELTSNFSADGYRDAVRQAVRYIYAGDIFQVNLAQRLLYPAADDPVALYLRLRRRNPAPFAGFFDGGPFQVISASPERFLQLTGQRVETRPIKGTRQRIDRPEADLFAGDLLRRSEKDRAENVMIVDLMRNDLSRVCRPESVCVTQLCEVETYQYVQHLVSAVQGELETGRTAWDLIRATFPGGSITGAPKVRAMQIIAELEPTARGPYCGSLGYLGFDGAMDLNILIRTVTASGGWWQIPVGGGIVAQSTPQAEYEETWHKATGILRSLR